MKPRPPQTPGLAKNGAVAPTRLIIDPILPPCGPPPPMLPINCEPGKPPPPAPRLSPPPLVNMFTGK